MKFRNLGLEAIGIREVRVIGRSGVGSSWLGGFLWLFLDIKEYS